jgi:hypothetical protein
MVLRTIVFAVLLFDVYIDDTTLNIDTFCTWPFFFLFFILEISKDVAKNHTDDRNDHGDNALTNSQCKPPCRHGRTQTLNNRPGCSVSLSLFLQHCSEAFVCFVFSRWPLDEAQLL